MKKSEIFKLIYNQIYTSNIKVIGVNGIDGSGKTTFASELSEYLKIKRLDVCIIRMDDFHQPKAIRYSDPNPIESYYNHAFDTKALVSKLLQPISIDGEVNVTLKHLDLITDQYTITKSYSITKDTIVIIEGVLLFKIDLQRYFDYKVYLDITFDEMLRRVRIRDESLFEEVEKRYNEKYIPVQKKYMLINKPKEASDLVLDYNNCESEVTIRSDK